MVRTRVDSSGKLSPQNNLHNANLCLVSKQILDSFYSTVLADGLDMVFDIRNGIKTVYNRH